MNKKRLCWDDVSIGKYLEMENILKKEGDTLSKALDLLQILTGTDYSKVPIDEYMEKVAELSFLQTDVPTIDLPNEIALNGRKYTLKNDVDKITASQFIDYNNYIQSEDNDKIIKIVGTFIIPKGHIYGDGYEFDTVMEDAKDIPLPIANSIAFFLRKQSNKSLKRSLYSLAFRIMMNRKVSWKKRIAAVNGLAVVYRNLGYYLMFWGL